MKERYGKQSVQNYRVGMRKWYNRSLGNQPSRGKRKNIWDSLISEATKLRPYLDYILEKERVIQEIKHSVTTVKEKLNKKLVDYAKNAIEFLNGLIEEEIRKAGIRGMISIITWARKVVNQYHHLESVKANIGIMAHEIKVFIEMFNPLVKMGLPFFR